MAIASLPVLSWFVKRLDDGSDEPLGLLVLGFWHCSSHGGTGIPCRPAREARTAGALVVLTSVSASDPFRPCCAPRSSSSERGPWFGLHRKAGLMGLLMLSLPVVASLQFYAGYPMRVAAAEGIR